MHQALLVALQRGVPLARHPWLALAQALGLAEAEVLAAARDLFAQGVARRFGAVFDSHRLGYAGTLCAVDVPSADIARATAPLLPHPGVTHCYEREGRPNLWFTLTVPAEKLDDELRRIGDALKPYPVFNLPAIRRFKVEVILDPAAGSSEPEQTARVPEPSAENTLPDLSVRDKALIRKIQGNLPLTEDPFGTLAQELQWDPAELLQRLAQWKQAGILRRVGFIFRHRVAGFAANGMCVWPVGASDVERAGRCLAGFREVTHCYERRTPPFFPFNLFAMIHAPEREAAEKIFLRLSAKAALSGGRMLVSLREFKKSSPVFFGEGAHHGGIAP